MNQNIIERVLNNEILKPALAIKTMDTILDRLDLEAGPEETTRLQAALVKLEGMLPADTVGRLKQIRARKEVLAARKDKVEARLLAEAGRIAGEMALLHDNQNFEIGRNKLPWAMSREKAEAFHAAREKALAGHSYVDDEKQILADMQGLVKGI